MHMNSITIKMQSTFQIVMIVLLVTSCKQAVDEKLPYIGLHTINERDTIYHKIPDFNFLNQDSISINNQKLSNHIYVADFFYSNCPTICPKVKNQMLRIYDRFQEESGLKLISFALDPIRDNVENLSLYSYNLGVNSEKWHFLTGDQFAIWDLADDFLISVQEDAEEPGGIAHSGKIILIDQEGHIRGFAEGTMENEVNRLMDDIDLLLKTLKDD